MHTLTQVWKQLEGRIVEEKFPLLQQLGGSEHDAVFLTERVSNGRQRAAIKLISAEGRFAGKQAEEAQLSRWSDAARLSHPHLLRVFESGRCQIEGVRFLYVVTEYAEENLAQILPQRALSLEEANALVRPTAEALAFLHSAGYAHGRIKPGNIMAVENQLKISADSVRKNGERDERQLSVYDAPEIARKGVSPAGDVWSLGATLVAVLTQREPDTKRAENGQVGIADTIPEPFHEVAQRCLRLDPRQRATIGEIIETFRGEEPPERRQDRRNADTAHGNASTSVSQREGVSTTKRPLLRGFVAALFISAVLIAALLFALWLGRKFVAQHGGISAIPSPSTETPSVAGNLPPTQSRPAPAVAPSTEKASSVAAGIGQGRVLKQVLPEVSRTARNSIHGRVKANVRVSVDAAGNVSHAKFSSPGPSKYFAKQALEAARNWKFSPPQTDGQASSSEWLLRFEFGRTETRVFPSEIKP
jgi:TonB family protein